MASAESVEKQRLVPDAQEQTCIFGVGSKPSEAQNMSWSTGGNTTTSQAVQTVVTATMLRYLCLQC